MLSERWPRLMRVLSLWFKSSTLLEPKERAISYNATRGLISSLTAWFWWSCVMAQCQREWRRKVWHQPLVLLWMCASPLLGSCRSRCCFFARIVNYRLQPSWHAHMRCWLVAAAAPSACWRITLGFFSIALCTEASAWVSATFPVVGSVPRGRLNNRMKGSGLWIS